VTNADDTAKPEKPRQMLQTVERALSLLEFVAAARRPPTIKDVSAGLGLNVTTIYHLYNTLEYRGYLRRDPDGTLRIGARAGVLNQALIAGSANGRDLHPVVANLAAAVEETVYLTSWADGAVVIQDVVEGPQALRVSGLYIGYHGREVQRASGKAVLAHLEPDAVEAVIRRNKNELDSEIMTRAAATLTNELKNVRRNGFALDDQTYTPGVYCVASPYFNASGRVAGSIAVSVPAVRFSKQRKNLTAAVIRAARECSEIFGYLPSATG
jgi:DNA-binding IclR family transcriptional regulator